MEHWFVSGSSGSDGGAGTGVVALTAGQSETGADLVRGFDDVMRESVPRAGAVSVEFPPYRGMRLVPLLAWLVVERLAAPDAEVTWYLDRQQGPDSVLRMLTGLGWSLRKERAPGKRIGLRGRPPASSELPRPRSFLTDLGRCSDVELAGDYGVFSPDRVDDGTRLLLDVALRRDPVPVVADVGIGYGALAIGLVRNGVAGSAVGTDVDGLALWLAHRNADTHGIRLTTELSPDPESVPPTPLTVCNVPTHIPAEASARLMKGLGARSAHGPLLIVVHASLEARYARHLTASGEPTRYPGSEHVVLATGA